MSGVRNPGRRDITHPGDNPPTVGTLCPGFGTPPAGGTSPTPEMRRPRWAPYVRGSEPPPGRRDITHPGDNPPTVGTFCPGFETPRRDITHPGDKAPTVGTLCPGFGTPPPGRTSPTPETARPRRAPYVRGSEPRRAGGTSPTPDIRRPRWAPYVWGSKLPRPAGLQPPGT
jgi:hypothetical protein